MPTDVLQTQLVTLIDPEWKEDYGNVKYYIRDALTAHHGCPVKQTIYKDVSGWARYRCVHVNPDYKDAEHK